jgi:acyl-CoA thioesterase I
VFLRGRMRIGAVMAVTAAALTCLSLLLTWPASPPARAVDSATLAAGTAARGLSGPSGPPPGRTGHTGHTGHSGDLTGHSEGLAGCVRDLGASRRKLLVVVGASFTAGVGPGSPDRSWAVVLARALGWNAVVYGVPGAGYVRPGAGRRGPVAAEIARIDLSALDPALVIVQAGHDDIGVPPALEERQAAETIALIHAEAPRAQIAVLTVFLGRAKLARALPTDQAIVAGATAADPDVIVMDPLTGHWQYQRSADGLHPTVQGSDSLAQKADEVLHGYGVRAAGAAGPPVLCDYSTISDYSSAGKHRRIKVPPPGAVSARTHPA